MQPIRCGITNVPLNLEHVIPRARGGSNRPSNLVLACIPCNTENGSQAIEEFLAANPALLACVKAQIAAPLKDAAAANATRNARYEARADAGLPIETGSGGLTSFNRCRLEIPKTHALDAVCVRKVDAVAGWQVPTLTIKAAGRGTYCRTKVNKHGMPRGDCMRTKLVHGFQTGDRVRADVPTGRQSGVRVGRVAVSASGFFNLQTGRSAVQGINHKHFKILQRADGYGYAVSASSVRHCVPTAFFPRLKAGVSSGDS